MYVCVISVFFVFVCDSFIVSTDKNYMHSYMYPLFSFFFFYISNIKCLTFRSNNKKNNKKMDQVNETSNNNNNNKTLMNDLNNISTKKGKKQDFFKSIINFKLIKIIFI